MESQEWDQRYAAAELVWTAGAPWPHDASATAVTVSGSRNAQARTTADRGLRIIMGTGCWATMTGS